MYTYRREIRTPHSIEVEIYKSIRKVGKYYGGRNANSGKSGAKQKEANRIRAAAKYERLIDCNFCENDYFCRFSAPYGTFTDEESFMREVNNWFKRIKRRCEARGLVFKYIGFRECGKSGKNWHLHIILSEEVSRIARECWHWQNGGINLAPLWQNHEYRKLAEYIHKDVFGNKRMMTSRNLTKPDVVVKKATRREIRMLERGELLPAPEGYMMIEDELSVRISEVTGAAWYFKYKPVCCRSTKKQNRRS